MTTSTSARAHASSARTPSSVKRAVGVAQQRRRRGRAGCRRGRRRAQRRGGHGRLVIDRRWPSSATSSRGTSCSRPAATDERLVTQACAAPRGRRARSRSRTSCTRRSRTRCARAAIDQLWRAPGRGAARARWAGPTIVTTGTASGKSLCFNLPTLDVLCRDAARARAVPLPDQGARPGPGARAARARRQARAAGDLRRRHAARAARARSAGARTCPHQPRHAAPRDPAQPPRRGATSSPTSRSSSSTRRTSTAACSARTSPTCCGGCGGSPPPTAPTPRFLLAQRDDRQPGRARRAADRPRRRHRDRPRRLAGRQARRSRCGTRRSSTRRSRRGARALAEAADLLAELVSRGRADDLLHEVAQGASS